MHNAAIITNMTLNAVSLIGSSLGFRVGTDGEINGLTVTNSHFDNDQYGFYTNADTQNAAGFNKVINVEISGSTFNNDQFKGVYAEVLSNATFNGDTFDSSGFGSSSPNGINLNLKNGNYSGITIENSSFDSDGTGTATGSAITIDGRNDAPSYNGVPATISAVALLNNVFTGTSPIDLSIGDNVTGVTLSGEQFGGSGVGFVSFDTAGGFNLGNSTFSGSLAAYVINSSVFGVDATGAAFNGFVAGAGSVPANLASYYATEDKILDGVDEPNLGLVRIKAGDVFVTPNSFSSVVAAFATTTPSIERGINVASSGDSVYVEAGTYSGDVNVNKQVSLEGAQAGVNAAGRSGAESVISSPDGTTELQISVSDATVDGFTIEGNTNRNLSGAGVWIHPGVSGTHLFNNIIQNNIIGLDLTNASPTDQGQIEGNLFQNNTISGPSGGTDIYADQFTAGAGGVQNVLISGNTFTNAVFNENGWGIGISNTGAVPFNDLQIVGNTFSNAGRGMYFFDATNATISGNTVTGATHYAVGLFGNTDTGFSISENTLNGNGVGVELVGEDSGPTTNVTGLSITNNFIQDNATGIYVDVTVTVTSGDIEVHGNSIAGNTDAGLENDAAITVNADENWWGSATGPTNAANPGGTGDLIIDPTVTFSPWLTSGTDTQPGEPGFQPSGESTLTISGSTTGTEGAVYVLTLSPSSEISSWSVNWGDGTAGDPDITTVSGTASTFTHVFADEGTYTISAVAHTSGGDVDSNDVTVAVADAPLTGSTGATVGGTERISGSSILSGATFSDANPGNHTGDFNATISWGDTTTSIGTITYNATANDYTVSGSHTYAVDGSYGISISVVDEGGSTTTITGSANCRRGHAGPDWGELYDFRGDGPFGDHRGDAGR